jgi:hypothetical protein
MHLRDDHQSAPVPEPEEGTPDTSTSSRPARRTRRARVAAGTAVATIFLLAGSGVAVAAPSGGFAGPGGGSGVVGTLQSVKGSTLTVKTTAGKTETAKVTSKTTYDKTTTGKISLLKAGATVTAIGTLSNGSLDASRVMIGTTGGFAGGGRPGGATGIPGGGEGGIPSGATGGTPPSGAGGTNPTAPTGRANFTFVSGTVSDITATSFALTETSGTKGTVKVASTTTISDTTKITESGLKVGQTVTIRGTTAKSGTVTALVVTEGKATGFGFGGFGGSGRPPAA